MSSSSNKYQAFLKLATFQYQLAELILLDSLASEIYAYIFVYSLLVE